MAVAFDAVGPGATATDSSITPLTWTHICGGTATDILVFVTTDNGGSNLVTSVRYGPTGTGSDPALTFVKFVASGNSTAGGMAVYYLANPPTGSNTVSAAFTGGGLTGGGSLSFTGGGQIGTAVSNFATSGTSVSVSVLNTVTGGMIGAATCVGAAQSPWTATNSGTLRFSLNFGSNSGSENIGGGSWTSTGGGASQTVGLSGNTSDFWGLVAVEVQPSGGAPAASVYSRPPLPPGRRSPMTIPVRPGAQIPPQGTESGTFTPVLPAPLTALTGVVTHQGSFAVTLPAPLTALSGKVVRDGTFTPVIPPPVTALSGTITHKGAFTPVLPAPLTALAGTVTHRGAFTPVLPPPLTSLSGTVTHKGSFAVVLPPTVTTLAGGSGKVGAFAVTLPAPLTSLSGTVTHRGGFSVTLPAPATSLTGTSGTPSSHSGAFIIVLPPGVRDQTEDGDFTLVLPALVTSLTGVRGHTGSFSIVLPAPRTGLAAATGKPLALVLPAPQMSLTGRTGHAGAFNVTLPAPVLTLTGHAPIPIPGTLAVLLPAPSTALAGRVAHTGNFHISLDVPLPHMSRFAMFGAESRATADVVLPELVTSLFAQVPDPPGWRSRFIGRWISYRLPRKEELCTGWAGLSASTRCRPERPPCTSCGPGSSRRWRSCPWSAPASARCSS